MAPVRPATVTFRRFTLDDGQGVKDYYDSLVGGFDHPEGDEENVETRRGAEAWHAGLCWAWDYGGAGFGDFWVEGSGRITAT